MDIMTDILMLSVLRGALKHYERTRQKGHTYCSVAGIKSVDGAILITHDHESARNISREHDIPTRTIYDLQKSLPKVPVIFDNGALSMLFGFALEIIEGQESELIDLRRKINSIKKILTKEEKL